MVYHHSNCLNTKKAYVNLCRLCIDSCPHQAISIFRELDARKCTECGVCSAVCPSDGFVYYGIQKIFEYIRRADRILMSCPQALPEGYEIPCLGIFDRDLWLTLLIYAGEKEVTLYTGACAQCPDRKACGRSVQIFNELHSTWQNHPQIKLKVAPDGGLSEQLHGSSPYQVQDEEKGWRDLSREKLEAMLPGLTSDESYLIPKTKAFLEETWRTHQWAIERLPLPALEVSERCTNCGDCAEVCPQEALRQKQSKEQWSLVYEPLKCVHCQRCVNICRTKAMSRVSKYLSYRLFTGRILLHSSKE